MQGLVALWALGRLQPCMLGAFGCSGAQIMSSPAGLQNVLHPLWFDASTRPAQLHAAHTAQRTLTAPSQNYLKNVSPRRQGRPPAPFTATLTPVVDPQVGPSLRQR